MERMSSMRSYKVFRQLSLICVFITGLLLSIEFILRILGFFYTVKTDLGKIKNEKTFNIICIGDSFTFGWGVNTVDSYPKQLERTLNGRNPNRNFKVFNLAVPGSNSSQHLLFFKRILNRYQRPDLVIILTGANNSWNFADSDIIKFIKNDPVEFMKARLDIFFSGLKVYRMTKLILLNLKGRTPESGLDPFKQIPKYEKINTDILKRMLEYDLIQIINLAKSNNIKLILLNYPRGDLYGDNVTEKTALKFGIPFVDNYSAFNERLKQTNFKELFLYDNSHPSEKGCGIIAEGVYKAIVKKVLEE